MFICCHFDPFVKLLGRKLRRWFRNSMDTNRIPSWSPWPSWYLGSEPWDLILINHSANYWRLLQLVKLFSFAISVLMARRIYAGSVSRSDHGISYYSLDRTKQHNLWRPKQAERPVTQNPRADMKDALLRISKETNLPPPWVERQRVFVYVRVQVHSRWAHHDPPSRRNRIACANAAKTQHNTEL